MKLLTALISLFVVTMLTIDFMATETYETQNKRDASAEHFTAPEKLTTELLAVEKHWSKLKAERLDKTDKSVDVPVKVSTNKVLTLGENSYQLFGIFIEGNSPFILLKDESDTFIKLTKGSVISDNITLVEISADRVTFEKNDERIEFKLFERKNHAEK